MFVIGIEGKTGSGKTTVGNYMKEKYGVCYIEVDDLMKQNNLWDDLNNVAVKLLPQGKSVHYTRNIAGKARIRSMKPPVDIKAAIQVIKLAHVTNKLIEEELEACQAAGREFVVVDFAKLDVMRCWKRMDARIMVERDDKKRSEGLQQREGEGFEDWMKKFDSFSKHGWLQYNKRSITNTITNNGDLKDLHQQIDAIFVQIQLQNKRKGFKEGLRNMAGACSVLPFMSGVGRGSVPRIKGDRGD